MTGKLHLTLVTSHNYCHPCHSCMPILMGLYNNNITQVSVHCHRLLNAYTFNIIIASFTRQHFSHVVDTCRGELRRTILSCKMYQIRRKYEASEKHRNKWEWEVEQKQKCVQLAHFQEDIQFNRSKLLAACEVKD